MLHPRSMESAKHWELPGEELGTGTRRSENHLNRGIDCISSFVLHSNWGSKSTKFDDLLRERRNKSCLLYTSHRCPFFQWYYNSYSYPCIPFFGLYTFQEIHTLHGLSLIHISFFFIWVIFFYSLFFIGFIPSVPLYLVRVILFGYKPLAQALSKFFQNLT